MAAWYDTPPQLAIRQEDAPDYYADWDFEPQPFVACPFDGGHGVYLGALGRSEWFRCRACGITFNHKTEEL